MPFPNLEQVIIELQCLQHSIIANELLTSLEVAFKSEKTRNDLVNRLRGLVENPSEDLAFNKAIYRLLLVLGKMHPRNQYKNGRPIDPISLTYIKDENLFISIDCYQWSIIELANYYQTRNEYVNPITRVLFSQQDILHMRKIAEKSGINLSLREVEQELPANHHRAPNRRSSLLLMFSMFRWTLPTVSFLGESIQNSQMFRIMMPPVRH